MMISGLIPVLFVILIYGGMITVVVLLLLLLSRFVKASERIAGATEEIARKLRDDIKP